MQHGKSLNLSHHHLRDDIKPLSVQQITKKKLVYGEVEFFAPSLSEVITWMGADCCQLRVSWG